MINQFKLWAAETISGTWTSEMEKFILAKQPSNHAELDAAIQEFELIQCGFLG